MNYKHGFSSHPLYSIWYGVKQRCYYKNTSYYKNYGGRGIEICGDWLNHPNIFIGWALSNGWEKGLHIDRIDNDGNYSPNNCRFVNRQASMCNQRLLQSHNTTGFRGVSIHKNNAKNPYQVRIRVHGNLKYLGSFLSAKLAALRYDVEAYLLNDGRPMNFIDKI